MVCRHYKRIHGFFLIHLRLSANAAAFRDMKMDILAEASDYGTRNIRETMKGKFGSVPRYGLS